MSNNYYNYCKKIEHVIAYEIGNQSFEFAGGVLKSWGYINDNVKHEHRKYTDGETLENTIKYGDYIVVNGKGEIFWVQRNLFIKEYISEDEFPNSDIAIKRLIAEGYEKGYEEGRIAGWQARDQVDS